MAQFMVQLLQVVMHPDNCREGNDVKELLKQQAAKR